MVSLNISEQLYRETQDDPQLRVLIQSLFDEELDKPDSHKPTTSADMVLLSLNAIRDDNKKKFIECFDAFSKRKPNEQSAWIYDDVLIFSMILGAKKFELDCAPLVSVLRLRHAATEHEKRKLTDAFRSVCEGTYDGSGPFGFVAFVFMYLLPGVHPRRNHLQEVLAQVRVPGFYSALSPFSKILASKAFDLVLTFKDLKDPGLTQLKESFVKKFPARVSVVSNILYFAVFSVLVYLTVVVSHGLFVDPETTKDLLERINHLNSLLGFGGLIGFLWVRKHLVDFLNRLMYVIYGFDHNKLRDKS